MLLTKLRFQLIERMSVKTMRYVSAVPRAKADGLVARIYDMIAEDFFINGSLTGHSKVPPLLAGVWTGGRECILVADRLDRTTKEAMTAVLSRVNDCPYCGDMLVSTYYPAHALGHPFSLMIQAAGMLAHGVFERFSKLRVAFLEGGATWVPFFMDRLDRSYHGGHVQLDLEGNLLGGPKQDEKASRYFKKQLREGRIFVGFDCDDDGLGTAVNKGGREPFLFGSDFPHEVFDAAKCRHEIDELLERDDLTQADKEAALGGNALRFYLPAL